MYSGKPEQEFQRDRRNNPYDGSGLLIDLSFIDNFLSTFGVRRQDAAF
jgi:hypothetical protein